MMYNLNGEGYTSDPLGGEASYQKATRAMAKIISTAWINFFNTLDPNGNKGEDLFSGEKWPIYDSPADSIVFNINGSHIEADDWRSDGMDWMIKHALDVFGN